MSRIASTRPLRSTRSRRRRRWRNLPTNGPQRASRISGAAFPSFKRCKAKPARPACCTVRCNRVRSRRRSRHRKAMIPNMYKIAGELTPAVFHVAARALATSALSIFGDHSDVMAVRNTGFALISSGNVQEAHDTALIAQTATLESRIPFLHFFDGFRTSHELNTLDLLSDEQIRAMISDELVRAHRERSLSPEHPFIRGTAHNPDTYFQAREASNVFYDRVPGIVQAAMDRFAQLTGRQYHLFEYDGAADAERIIVVMGSGSETSRATARVLCAAGAKVGVLQVRLYRPFSAADFIATLPSSVRSIAVLEETKEPGAPGEPLYLDVMSTLGQAVANGERAQMPRVVGGRYGISCRGSNQNQPEMVELKP